MTPLVVRTGNIALDIRACKTVKDEKKLFYNVSNDQDKMPIISKDTLIPNVPNWTLWSLGGLITVWGIYYFMKNRESKKSE